MGTVFEARHARMGHRVAIKVLGEDVRRHPELVKRFEQEARAAGALSSPHAVRVHDIDQTVDGTPFMVMELLTGRDLAHIVENDGAQPIGASVRWVIEACDAIGEAHRLGIVHRDIKPSNLFLCRDTGSIKVLDFGIAKHVAAKDAALTLGVTPLGTPQYMSPEQVRCAKDVDARTDIWSLGVTLYELVCGRPPFDHDVPQACIAAIAADPIPDPREFRPDLPDALAAIVMRALAKDRSERFGSVEELVLALAPFVDAPSSSDSWRVISTARRTATSDHTTVSGDGVASGATASRKVEDEQTVPPAVSRANRREPRGQRVRSTLALASAAVMGLAALVATPRCVGARLDAAAKATLAEAPQVSDAVANAAALPAQTSRPAPGPAPAPAPAPVDVLPSPSSETDPARDAAPPALEPARAAPKPAGKVARPPSRGSARSAASARAVHGGISSPGF